MMHRDGRRNRVISSCIPCYTKKQRCNRQTPCNHCAQRRRPEECLYYPTPGAQVSGVEECAGEDEAAGLSGDNLPSELVPGIETNGTFGKSSSAESIEAVYGYVNHSESNTVALLRKCGLFDERRDRMIEVPGEMVGEIDHHLQRLPDRKVLDFLIEFFMKEVHWMEQLIYAPWFIGQYQDWWKLERPSRVFDVEFTVLFLRICAYTSLFLPSPSYTIDRVGGVPLDKLRADCDDLAGELAAISARADPGGGLLRVQHLSLLGLQRQYEGRTDAFRNTLNMAIQVAQRIGLHRGRSAWNDNLQEFEKDIRSRVFCNLYIWDSNLSRQLDTPPSLPASLSINQLPHIMLLIDTKADEEPSGFMERVLQARLANFWRMLQPGPSTDGDLTVIEQRYEAFCRDFLWELPSAFALQPDKQWDDKLTRLPRQRQMLHIAIYESLCYNFRPVLLRDETTRNRLSAEEHVLIVSHMRKLAVAALKMLDNVATLHDMLGRAYTRLPTMIIPAFEAAVVLGSLLMDTGFPGEDLDSAGRPKPYARPLDEDASLLTRDRCHLAVQKALALLEMLSEVSEMAATCAGTLACLVTPMSSG